MTEPPIEPTAAPTEEPEAVLNPTAKPVPTVRPVEEGDSKPNSTKGLKKGDKITDRKTQAVYKVTGTGKNRAVQYLKSTKKNLESVTIPASVKLQGRTYKVTSIGKGAFQDNTRLRTVKIGKNVKTIGKQAFSGCTKLINVAFGKNVTTIGANAFSKCTALIIITIPPKVKKIGNKAFYQCKKLQYILVKTNKLTTGSVGDNVFGKGAASIRVKTDKSKWKLYARIFITQGMSGKAVFVVDPVKLVI